MPSPAKATGFPLGIRFLFLSILICLGMSDPAAAADVKPNIVLIMADDLGWADLACYGSDLHLTPHLDALAREGIRFTDAYAAAPVCSPTRAALMTGKYPARLHMTVWYEASQRPPENRRLIPPHTVGNLPHKEITLAEVLKSAGYFTAHVGKWHLGDAGHYPETHGFDVNIGGTFWGAPPTFFYPYRGPFGRSREARYVPDLEFGQPGEYLTDRLTDEAIKIIDQSRGSPFFLHLSYHSVHTPIEAKQKDVARFQTRLNPGLKHRNPVYAAMVASLDENVGRIVAKLKQESQLQNTLIIFTSDNGGYINTHRGRRVTNNAPLRSGKGSLYEGGVRVPLIIRLPDGQNAGSVSAQPVVTMDLYPTILDRAGVAIVPSESIDGVSLTPILHDPESSLPERDIYFHYPHYYHAPRTRPVSAVRSGKWKLIEHLGRDRLEVFDLENDIGEKTNLAESHPRKTTELKMKLARWRANVAAQMPTINANR